MRSSPAVSSPSPESRASRQHDVRLLQHQLIQPLPVPRQHSFRRSVSNVPSHSVVQPPTEPFLRACCPLPNATRISTRHLSTYGTMNRPQNIISGRQIGADRGALDFAIAHGFGHGGSCARGRKTAQSQPGTSSKSSHRQNIFIGRFRQSLALGLSGGI